MLFKEVSRTVGRLVGQWQGSATRNSSATPFPNGLAFITSLRECVDIQNNPRTTTILADMDQRTLLDAVVNQVCGGVVTTAQAAFATKLAKLPIPANHGDYGFVYASSTDAYLTNLDTGVVDPAVTAAEHAFQTDPRVQLLVSRISPGSRVQTSVVATRRAMTTGMRATWTNQQARMRTQLQALKSTWGKPVAT